MSSRKNAKGTPRSLIWNGPKSVCVCGHLGDGAASEHRPRYAPGHGACTVPGCACQQFTWDGWTAPYQTYVAMARAREQAGREQAGREERGAAA